MITFFTGARRCFLASTPLVKRPVDSTTISAPTEAQSISAGSLVLKTLKLFPSTAIVSSVCVTLCGRLPRTESYFKRCARVFASVTSLTATNWMSLSSSAVRTMLRPMRPKPLMPTLMGITSSGKVSEIAAVQERVTAAGEQKMLWVAQSKVNALGELGNWKVRRYSLSPDIFALQIRSNCERRLRKTPVRLQDRSVVSRPFTVLGFGGRRRLSAHRLSLAEGVEIRPDVLHGLLVESLDRSIPTLRRIDFQFYLTAVRTHGVGGIQVHAFVR